MNKNNSILVSKKTEKSFAFSFQNRIFRYWNFLEFVFYGLNYHNKRVYHSQRLIFYVDVHRSHKFFIHEPITKSYKTRIHKRRILIFTLNKIMADRFSAVIKKFRMPNVYTGKGIYLKNDNYKVKTGKVRKK